MFDKCRWESRELINKGVCDKGFIWNASNCGCECDKSCDFGEYLHYKSCKFTKKLVDKLAEEYNQNVEEVTLAKITSAEDEYVCKCNSCTL